MSMDKRKGCVYAWLGTVIMYVQRKKKRYTMMMNDGLTKSIYIKKTEHMHLVCKEDPRYRFLPKTFSNCNQLVASFLKHFDHIVWKELISVKTFFFV